MLNALAAVSPALAGKVAFRFFCSPRRLPIREKDAAFLATAKNETFRFQNLKIRTYFWSAPAPIGKSVLLLHGWESSSARWQKYVKGLHAAGYDVHAIDAPASGNSEGKLLNAVLFSAVVRAYISKTGVPHLIVGHSLGGAAAVMSTTLENAPHPPKMALLGVFAESTRVIRDFANMLGASEKVVQAMYREIEKRSGKSIEEYSVVMNARKLTDVKGLVIHDIADDVAPVEEGQAVAIAWGAEMYQTEGLGHRLQDKTVVQKVVAFAGN